MNTDQNVLISAGPGSGKTTTLIEASKLIPKHKTSLFAAFNKSIVEELTHRLPSTTKCSTLHSIGMRALMSHYRMNFKVNGMKGLIFIEDLLKEKKEEKVDDKEQYFNKSVYKFKLLDAVNLIRSTLTDLSEGAVFQMCQFYDLDLAMEEVKDALLVMKKMAIYNRSFNEDHNQIDFIDMIHIISTNDRIKLDTYDFVWIDEVQDLSSMQQKFLKKLIKPHIGRLMLVGDRKQAIYSFAGASVTSFDELGNIANTITLPLSISYRCGKNIVAKAKELYDDIEANPSNIDGEVRQGAIAEIREGDMVVCRNNRPLFVMYYKLLEKGVGAIIVGQDIQRGLESLISKHAHLTAEEGIEKCHERLEKLEEELVKRGVQNPRESIRFQNLFDKVMVIEVVGRRFKTVQGILDEIKRMFSDKKKCVKLMTIHKSKGLESDRVFIIERFEGQKLLPSKYAVQDWEKTQEKNLEFVAITRAKKSLIYIPDLKVMDTEEGIELEIF